MLKSKKISRSRTTKISRLGAEIEKHPAWRGVASLTECAHLLAGLAPFTFVLSHGFDKHHYILSFVDADGIAKHRNVRVFSRGERTIYMNGGSGEGYESIVNLIPSCLNCSADVCRPL